jgi:hypothetical protein
MFSGWANGASFSKLVLGAGKTHAQTAGQTITVKTEINGVSQSMIDSRLVGYGVNMAGGTQWSTAAYPPISLPEVLFTTRKLVVEPNGSQPGTSMFISTLYGLPGSSYQMSPYGVYPHLGKLMLLVFQYRSSGPQPTKLQWAMGYPNISTVSFQDARLVPGFTDKYYITFGIASDWNTLVSDFWADGSLSGITSQSIPTPYLSICGLRLSGFSAGYTGTHIFENLSLYNMTLNDYAYLSKPSNTTKLASATPGSSWGLKILPEARNNLGNKAEFTDCVPVMSGGKQVYVPGSKLNTGNSADIKRLGQFHTGVI